MDNTQTINTTKKTSLVKYAAWSIALEITLIFSYLFLIFRKQWNPTPDEFMAFYPISQSISAINMILLLIFLFISIRQACNLEKQDELSRLHKYKAGYFSHRIVIFLIIIALCVAKEYGFSFTNGFSTTSYIAFIILFASQLVENIIFIILEKFSTE